MKYGIIWWWNTLCYKNNRRRLTKASVDSGFKNSCPKSCLDHWILKPLKLWERARTGILYQAQFWPRQEDGTEVTCFTLLPSLPSWTKEWQQCWSRWHSPSGSEPGQTSDLQQAMKDHFQTQVGLCGILNKWSSPSVITSCQLQHKQSLSIQGYKWQRRLWIRKEDRQCWPEFLASQEQSPALGEVAEWLCPPEGGTQAMLTGNQQLLKKAYLDGIYQSTVT